MTSVDGPRISGKFPWRAAIIAVLAPAAATLIARALPDPGPEAVSVFLLAVVIAAVVGGVWGGLAAAVLSWAGLTVIDVAPGGGVEGNVVAGVVFLAVAAIVGMLVGSAIDERGRAARREREARFLGRLAMRLGSADISDQVLNDVLSSLLEPFGLASCELVADLDGTPIASRADAHGVPGGGPREVLPLTLGEVTLGSLTATRPGGTRQIGRPERELLEAAARQVAAALDRARLQSRARLAQLDAETNQLRAAMFSSVTHDVRTPLASIKAGVTSMLDPSIRLSEAQEEELLQTILEETDRLNRLVGNILDLARIRAGALIPTRQSVAIDEVVEAVLSRLRRQLEGVEVAASIPADLPEVSADPLQLDQVITNLVENAARHSPAGGTVSLELLGTGERAVRVRISDQGPGVPAEKRERLFDAFERGDTAPETRGAGLGLAISKAIVVAHGGRIWIEDAPGGGAAVIFEIPIEEQPAEQRTEERVP